MRAGAAFVSAALVAGLLATPRISLAANDTAAAQALFEEARAAMAKGDFATACSRFEGSEALDPGAGTEFNLALCYDRAGRSASAWATYLIAAASYKSTNRPDWEAKARDRAAALAPTLSHVTIVLAPRTPNDVAITRDGAKVLPQELGAPIPVDPGHHVIEATAAAHPKWQKALDVASGASTQIEVALAPADATPEATTPKDPTPHASGGTSGSHTLAYVLGGAGVVGIGIGAGTGLAAISSNSASKRVCPNDGPCAIHARSDNAAARDWATVSTVSFIAGGALLAGAVVVFSLSPKSSGAARVTVAPAIGFGSVGLTGAF